MKHRVLTKVNGRLMLKLSRKEISRLQAVRDRHATPYLRERVGAMLKIAAGLSVPQVARQGLLKARKPDSVYGWLSQDVGYGVAGLFQGPRRPAPGLTEAQQRQLSRAIFEQPPEDYQLHCSRWSLRLLHRAVDFLAARYRSLSGVWRLLHRLPCHFKRGRSFLPSPDPEFNQKIRRLRAVVGYVRQTPTLALILFLDEFSSDRQPLISRAWWTVGRREQPPARRSPHADCRGRLVAALNGVTGSVEFHLASRITVACFKRFLTHLRQVYPAPVKLYLGMDNWSSVHQHRTVLALMQTLAITPIFLPTYTPDANPIERLWWNLSQEIIYLHRYSDLWLTFQERVRAWLQRFQSSSADALRMTGLSAKKAIAVTLGPPLPLPVYGVKSIQPGELHFRPTRKPLTPFAPSFQG
jgi:transposase